MSGNRNRHEDVHRRRHAAEVGAGLDRVADENLIPEVVKRYWWQHLLHTHRARRLANSLLLHGGSRLAVMTVPWYLEEPRIEEAVDPEETVSPELLQAAGDKPGSRS